MNGFLVVRLPELNRDPAGRGVFPGQPPCMDTVCYGGIDRMAWFDIDEEFYQGTLPPEIADVLKAIKKDNEDFSGIMLCKNIDTAFMLLDYSNDLQPTNELIAVRSEKLTKIKGSIDFDESKITWIGYDIVSLGHWSLLREGLFASPSVFTAWEKVLNNYGLFHTALLMDEYVQAYKAASINGVVEEILGDIYGIDSIEIGRIVGRLG